MNKKLVRSILDKNPEGRYSDLTDKAKVLLIEALVDNAAGLSDEAIAFKIKLFCMNWLTVKDMISYTVSQW